MPTYEVDIGGVTYEVDAPDENTAWKWANSTATAPTGPDPKARPAKIGKDAWADTLRKELSDNPAQAKIAAAGTALSNIWEGIDS